MSRPRILLLLAAVASTLTACEPITAPPPGPIVVPAGGAPGADRDPAEPTAFALRAVGPAGTVDG